METGSETKIVSWPAGERGVSVRLADAIIAANALSIWLAEQLDGFRLPNLPKQKRVQLSSACLHVAMEHQQSVNTLIAQGHCGSAVALIRPAIEACFRGHWLMLVASGEQLDGVGKDEKNAFPPFQTILSAIEGPLGIGNRMSEALRGQWWSRLCSYTHTGYQQIGARLIPSGLGSGYTDEELLAALSIASVAAIMSAASLASNGGDETLAMAIAARLTTLKSQ